MPKPADIYAHFHAIMEPIKVWVAGEPPEELMSPGLFITQVLQLVVWMHSSKADEILEYPAAQALCSWVGYVLSKNYFPAVAVQPPDVMAILNRLNPTPPEVLPELSTVPPNLKAHLKLKEEATKPRKVMPRPVKKVPQGSRVFTLSGLPTSRWLHEADAPIFDLCLAKSSSSKQVKTVPEAPKVVSKKRSRADSSPIPVKVEKREPLPKTKRPRTGSPDASRSLRSRNKRQASPPPSKSSVARGKQRAKSVVASEVESEEEEEEAEEEEEDSDQEAPAVDPSLVALDDDDVDQLVSSPPEDPPLLHKWTAKRKGRKDAQDAHAQARCPL
ncbi:hypothetical protein H1R20_g16122, partial [Candolleomyces eurysporus]